MALNHCCVVYPVWVLVDFDSSKESNDEIREKVMKAAEDCLQTTTIKGCFIECSDPEVELD